MGTKRKVQKNHSANKHYLFEEYENFLIEKEAEGKSPQTLKTYTYAFERYCLYNEFDMNTECNEVTQSSVYAFINHLRKTDINETTVNTFARNLRVSLYWLMDEKRAYTEPFKIPVVNHPQTRPKTYTDEEVELLLLKPNKTDNFVTWRSWLLVNWCLATGNRAETVCEVKLGDIDFRAKQVFLRIQKSRTDSVLPISSSLESALKEYIRMWRNFAEDDAYLFCNIGEEKLTVNALHKSFANYARSRGVEKTSVHALRHTFAMLYLRTSTNVFMLKKILNHKNLEITENYVRLFNQDLMRDYDKFSPLDNLKKNAKRTQKIQRFE